MVLIATEDEFFADTFGGMIGKWGMSVLHEICPSAQRLLDSEADLVLLDIRNDDGKMLELLREVKGATPDMQVLLVNRAENVSASIKAMQAGADDEIMAPCESGVLKKKLRAAFRRRRKAIGRGRSIFEAFSDAMAAATFAQAGEFDTAMDIYQAKRATRPEIKSETNNADSSAPQERE